MFGGNELRSALIPAWFPLCFVCEEDSLALHIPLPSESDVKERVAAFDKAQGQSAEFLSEKVPLCSERAGISHRRHRPEDTIQTTSHVHFIV